MYAIYGNCNSLCDIYMASRYGPLDRYGILRVAHALGMPGTFSPPPNSKKPPVSDPDMHHGACVTHVPLCMPGSLTRCSGESVPGIPGACTTRNSAYLVRGPWHGNSSHITHCKGNPCLLNLRSLDFLLFIKCTSFNVWVRYIVWNWYSTQTILPKHLNIL